MGLGVFYHEGLKRRAAIRTKTGNGNDKRDIARERETEKGGS